MAGNDDERTSATAEETAAGELGIPPGNSFQETAEEGTGISPDEEPDIHPDADTDDDPESFREALEDQDRQAEQFAKAFLPKVLRLRGVHVDRGHFLKAELHRRGYGAADITAAIKDSPAAAGVPVAVLDEIARAAIDFETKKSSAASFLSGLPGGFTLLATVPADVTQYYVHAFRVMQKVAYTYGWHDLLEDMDEVDDETLGLLASFLGVMLGVGGASNAVKSFAITMARPALQKQIADATLTKMVWYPVLKKTLRMVGVHVTKGSFAKSVTRVVPVVGGVISGSLTFASLKTQSRRLRLHLRELPPPHVDAAAYRAATQRADEAEPKEEGERGRFARLPRLPRRNS